MRRGLPLPILAPRPARGRAGRSLPLPGAALALLAAVAVVHGCATPLPTPSSVIDRPPATPGQSSSEASRAPDPTSSPETEPAAGRSSPTAPDESPRVAGAATAGLLFIATVGDAWTYHLFAYGQHGFSELPLPDPSIAEIVPLPGGRLVALLADGRLFVAPRGEAGLAGGDGWQPIGPRAPADLPDGMVIFGATGAPDGSRLAAIAKPRLLDLPCALVVIDPTTGRRRVHPLPDESIALPPAWLDDARVAVILRDRLFRTYIVVVEVATGRIVDRLPLRVFDLQISRDGRTVAVLGERSRILVGPTLALLRDRGLPDASPPVPDTDVLSGRMSIDADGTRLATVGQDGETGPWTIAIYLRAGGTWQPAVRIGAPLPDLRGGKVIWPP